MNLPTSASFLVTEDCNLKCSYCHTGDTKILMADFTEKEIKDIQINDIILGFDEYSNNINKHRQIKPTKVLKIFQREETELIKLTLEDGSELKTTPEHLILNPRGNSKYSWREARNFKVNQKINIFDSKKIKLSCSKVIKNEPIPKDVVYNLETESHTYIANNFCVHNCFETHNKSKMTIETIRKSLEYLCENCIKINDNTFHAMIFGGEPLLFPDLVEEIFEYGVKLAKKYNKIFTTSLVTNGTILNDKIKNIFLKYRNIANLNVQLSVDGTEEIHNMYRKFANGNGSFKLIEKNIEQFKEILLENNKLSIHGCCNKKSLPFLFENYKFFREIWQIPRIWFLPIHSEIWEENDVITYEKELNKVKDYILNTDNVLQEIKNFAPLDRCLEYDSFSSAPCGAGKNFITICANGDIYPCHHFYFNDPDKTLLLGNIWDGIDDYKREIFLKYDNNDLSCKKDDPNCDCYKCYRCIADNWVINGSILSQIKGPRCEMSKIERKVQLEIRKELQKMGLFNNKKCDIVEKDNIYCEIYSKEENKCSKVFTSSCDVVNKQDNCKCNLGDPPSKKGDMEYVILKRIIDKLEEMDNKINNLEEKQNNK